MKNCLFMRDDMNHFEIEGCLQSMVVLVDTREQDTKRPGSATVAFPVPMSTRRCLMVTMLTTLSFQTAGSSWSILTTK